MSIELGKFNKILSEENSSLQAQNEKLEIENQQLRMELAEVGNGKRIPIEHQNYIAKIAHLKVKVAVLEKRLAKYEPVSATEKYGRALERKSTTAFINIKDTHGSAAAAVKEDKTDGKIANDTDSYVPQVSSKINNEALIRKTTSKRMSAEEVFKIIAKHIKNNGPATRKDISASTGLSDGQIANAVEKYSSDLNIDIDPNNKRRHLYSI